MILTNALFPILNPGGSNRLEQARTASEGGPYTNFQPSTLNFEPLFSPKSNHSRTSAKAARKSNYSRTYAKTGGWGHLLSCKMCSAITLLFSSAMLTTISIEIVGAPTFPSLHPLDAPESDDLCKQQQHSSCYGNQLQHGLNAGIDGEVRDAGAADDVGLAPDAGEMQEAAEEVIFVEDVEEGLDFRGAQLKG